MKRLWMLLAAVGFFAACDDNLGDDQQNAPGLFWDGGLLLRIERHAGRLVQFRVIYHGVAKRALFFGVSQGNTASNAIHIGLLSVRNGGCFPPSHAALVLLGSGRNGIPDWLPECCGSG